MMKVGYGRMARDGGFGADAAHARGRRFRADRAGVLQHLATSAAAASPMARGDTAAAGCRSTSMRCASMDAIVTCQGGDYTTEVVHPQLRAAGWNGYWIDAASTLRMKR
jgi:aspartate-semialdehyde dehydrogenase